MIMMNCKYCGAGLPTKGHICPSCGKEIPVDQLKTIKEMIDPKWNEYKNENTAFYKSEQAYDNNKNAKIYTLIVIIIVIIILGLIFF